MTEAQTTPPDDSLDADPSVNVPEDADLQAPECMACKGAGTITEDGANAECPRCKGSGEDPDPAQVQAGNVPTVELLGKQVSVDDVLKFMDANCRRCTGLGIRVRIYFDKKTHRPRRVQEVCECCIKGYLKEHAPNREAWEESQGLTSMPGRPSGIKSLEEQREQRLAKIGEQRSRILRDLGDLKDRIERKEGPFRKALEEAQGARTVAQDHFSALAEKVREAEARVEAAKASVWSAQEVLKVAEGLLQADTENLLNQRDSVKSAELKVVVTEADVAESARALRKEARPLEQKLEQLSKRIQRINRGQPEGA